MLSRQPHWSECHDNCHGTRRESKRNEKENSGRQPKGRRGETEGKRLGGAREEAGERKERLGTGGGSSPAEGDWKKEAEGWNREVLASHARYESAKPTECTERHDQRESNYSH